MARELSQTTKKEMHQVKRASPAPKAQNAKSLGRTMLGRKDAKEQTEVTKGLVEPVREGRGVRPNSPRNKGLPWAMCRC